MKHYMIADLNGRILIEKDVNHTKEFINIETFSQGLYLITVELEDKGIIKKKVLIQ